MDVFEQNLADAEQMTRLAKTLCNTRKRRMRREVQETLGRALAVKRKDRASLDWIESSDLWVVLKPQSALERTMFDEAALDPLLRQSIVAVAAAVESYVVARAESLLTRAMSLGPLPPRLSEVPLTVGLGLSLQGAHQRPVWGYRRILLSHIEEQASADPDAMGKVFSLVGISNLLKRADQHRSVVKGRTHAELKALAERRNAIAHSADLVGRNKRRIRVREVEKITADAKEVVEAIDAVIESELAG